MAILKFKDLKFIEEKEFIKVIFLKIFYFEIPKKDLNYIGNFKIKEDEINFIDISEKKAWNKFDLILSKGFENLKNRLNQNPTTYVHQNSGIPLIGSNNFGLVDRDTNLIEIKPVTSCNLGCIFCSVDEGIGTKKKHDFVVEKDYLMSEFEKLAKNKNTNPLYAYINVHGEPLLYEPIVELISDLKKIPNVITGIITNGTLLNEKLIDDLAKVGLDRINISLSAIDKELANHLAGIKFNLDRLLKMIEYANQKLEVVVAPVYMKTLNDHEIDKIIEFIINLRKKYNKNFPLLGIQNFLSYKLGRNPVKETPWEEFNEKMKIWEKKHNINLSEDHFYKIFKTKKLEKPFTKGDKIKAEIIGRDRFPNQRIAKANNRIITIFNCNLNKGKIVNINILKDKHNIFVGTI